jgi:LytS/YehU family sensor histidine kinase
VLAVEDDGAGARDGQPHEGVGLRNTRARLARLYPEGYELVIDRPRDGGFRIRIEIPFLTEASTNGVGD